MGAKEIVLLVLLLVIIVICVVSYKVNYSNKLKEIGTENKKTETEKDEKEKDENEIVFVYNSESQLYEAEINGIKLVAEELYDGYQEDAKALLDSYYDRLPSIAQYMLDDSIRDFYGTQTVEELINHLGKPQIDVGRCIVTYLEHTLDDIHIIDVEFDGNFEEFWRMSIDG